MIGSVGVIACALPVFKSLKIVSLKAFANFSFKLLSLFGFDSGSYPSLSALTVLLK